MIVPMINWWSRRSFWVKLIPSYVLILFAIGNILFVANYIEVLQTGKQIYCATFDVDWECSLLENYVNTIWLVYLVPLVYIFYGHPNDLVRLVIGLRDSTIDTLFVQWPLWLLYSIPVVVFWHYFKVKRRKTLLNKLSLGISGVIICVIIFHISSGVIKYHNAVFAGNCIIESEAHRSTFVSIPHNQGAGLSHTSLPSAQAGEIDSSYSYDKDNVFHRCVVIEKADPSTFEPLHPFYSKDANSVFFGTEVIVDADKNTFRVLGHGWALDNKSVYLEGVKHPEADAQSFKQIDRDFYIDKDNVYFYDRVIEGVDVDSFEQLESNSYTKDKNSVYRNWDRIEDADPSTFELVGHIRFDIGKDKDTVYVAGNILEGANSDTFESWTENYFRDKDNHYYIAFQTANIVDKSVDPDTFEVLYKGEIPTRYAKDKNHVYYEGFIVEEADSDTFKATDVASGEDKSGRFHFDMIIE